MKPLIPPALKEIVTPMNFYMDDFGKNNPQILTYYKAKEMKPNQRLNYFINRTPLTIKVAVSLARKSKILTSPQPVTDWLSDPFGNPQFSCDHFSQIPWDFSRLTFRFCSPGSLVMERLLFYFSINQLIQLIATIDRVFANNPGDVTLNKQHYKLQIKGK